MPLLAYLGWSHRVQCTATAAVIVAIVFAVAIEVVIDVAVLVVVVFVVGTANCILR